MPRIEILGPWLHNRGDELMLLSVIEQFRDRAVIGVSSNLGLNEFPTYPELFKIKSYANTSALLNDFLQGAFREGVRKVRDNVYLAHRSDDDLSDRGWVREGSLDLLLDASGYGYGDPWSLWRTRKRAEYYVRLKQQGTRIVVLPQAFGPFEDPEKTAATRDLMSQCDVIYARDELSRGHLEQLGFAQGPRILEAPDITTILAAHGHEIEEDWSDAVAIVPNARMLDRTSSSVSQAYPDFILRIAREILRKGARPVLVVHEANDFELASDLRAEIGTGEIVDRNAIETKAILGAAKAVVSSRYHACVSSLSQGVPTIGTSWHYKYKMLFRDYGCEDLLLDTGAGEQELRHAVDRITERRPTMDLANNLVEAARAQKFRVESMWADIHSMLTGNARLNGQAPKRHDSK
ncbi:polysaccharide pyruvyl transferase family protein [Qipengyuania spongiae]|uniref:Polysaccharide pyruvyl transferase family protein n=1 Tax=Qipengyuania spongiae TaxID=2909673 RepID=A0ABY5T2K0_9SPHN|nr:polysaccharide pyruvyl transferase family protein [Qipengyuania spongiae]UVI39558.1 polysaccharide pyruvyl transferase family protein [Qipengyuania spongiae]